MHYAMYYRVSKDFPEHKHNFYELIVIEGGKGNHTLNGVTFSYEKNDAFLLTPKDSHFFTITQETNFLYIKFTEQIFNEKLAGYKNNNWYTAIHAALQNPNIVPGTIIKDGNERTHLLNLSKMLQQEFTKKEQYRTEAMLELFGIIMILVARNVAKILPYNSTIGKDKINEILSYIRLNAFDRDKMRIKMLAAEFCMSPNYISFYIRKHAGVPVQRLIIETKLKVAEQLLRQGNMNINEIASHLGFTDASHFNKLFKKYKLSNPSSFQ